MKILYIENHGIFSQIVINKFLSSHEVTITPTLSEARVLIQSIGFELLLVDYDLDDGKGEEIVKEITNLSNRPKIIAASSHNEGNRKLMEAGADAICSKMDFDQIGSVIKNICTEN